MFKMTSNSWLSRVGGLTQKFVVLIRWWDSIVVEWKKHQGTNEIVLGMLYNSLFAALKAAMGKIKL